MFGGRLKAIIAGKDRELELISAQLETKTREVDHLRDQIDRLYHTLLGTEKTPTIIRPAAFTREMSEDGLG